MNSIITAIVAFGAIGLAIGIILSIAAKVFEVNTDPKIGEVLDNLPGANCGGCGFAGCSACAEAIVKGEASVNACPSIDESSLSRIASIMGTEAEKTRKLVACVMCSGSNDVTVKKYEFDGTKSCLEINALNNGDKMCNFACLGYGDCVEVCKFDAITLHNTLASVDKDKCASCGMCVSVCPRNIIKLIPYDSKVYVRCSSEDKGAAMKAKCSVGCIGCGICAKNCPEEAIMVIDNHAVINQEKCVGCGICVEKCPKKIIETA
ncbi:MAG: Fe-S cluster domain-containing protein [Clostridia bacterium]|nr:Fe-S cluster domain-containing protein [Clostridia bacterium]